MALEKMLKSPFQDLFPSPPDPPDLLYMDYRDPKLCQNSLFLASAKKTLAIAPKARSQREGLGGRAPPRGYLKEFLRGLERSSEGLKGLIRPIRALCGP